MTKGRSSLWQISSVLRNLSIRSILWHMQGCLAEDTICAEMAYMFMERNKVRDATQTILQRVVSAAPLTLSA